MEVMKFQAEIVKKPSAYKFDYNKNKEMVYFTDGAMIRRFEIRQCVLDLSKFEQTDLIQYFIDEDEWPKAELKKLRYKDVGFTAIQLRGEGGICWINEKYYKRFRKYQFEYDGGNWVKVVNPDTQELEAVIATIIIEQH